MCKVVCWNIVVWPGLQHISWTFSVSVGVTEGETKCGSFVSLLFKCSLKKKEIDMLLVLLVFSFTNTLQVQITALFSPFFFPPIFLLLCVWMSCHIPGFDLDYICWQCEQQNYFWHNYLQDCITNSIQIIMSRCTLFAFSLTTTDSNYYDQACHCFNFYVQLQSLKSWT